MEKRAAQYNDINTTCIARDNRPQVTGSPEAHDRLRAKNTTPLAPQWWRDEKSWAKQGLSVKTPDRGVLPGKKGTKGAHEFPPIRPPELRKIYDTQNYSKCKKHLQSEFQGPWCTRCIIDSHNTIMASGKPNYKGCRIPIPTHLNVEYWERELTEYEDKEVIEFVKFGWPIGYEGDPPESRKVENHKGATRFPEFINSYLKKEITLGATLGPFAENPLDTPLAYSPLNSVPKCNGDNASAHAQRRAILDLSWPEGKSVNSKISKFFYQGSEVELQFPTVDNFLKLVADKGRGCLMFKRDLRRAYRQVYQDPRDIFLTSYTWEGLTYIDRSLAMGVRTGALCCSRMTSALNFIFTRGGYSGLVYLDDFCGLDTPIIAHQAYKALGDIIDNAGFVQSQEKCVPPSTNIIFLGIEVDSDMMQCRVPDSKMAEIVQTLDTWIDKKKASKRQLQSLIGRLAFLAKVVAPGRLFISRMLETLRSLRKQSFKFRISAEFRKDLFWWKNFVHQFNNKAIISTQLWSQPDAVFATDACLSGAGGVGGQYYFHVPFPPQFGDWHISALELLSILIAVKLWSHRWEGQKIQVFSDNSACIACLNSGKVYCRLMLQCLREITFLAAKRSFQIRAIHVQGKNNTLPDILSRIPLDGANKKLFQQKTAKMELTESEVPPRVFEFDSTW